VIRISLNVTAAKRDSSTHSVGRQQSAPSPRLDEHRGRIGGRQQLSSG
jgi:hypothetical protein